MSDASGTGGRDVHTQLDEVDGQGGSGRTSGPDLAVHDDELGKLGHLAFQLHNQLGIDANHSDHVSGTAKKWLTEDGLDSGKALGEVLGAWDTKVGTLKQACAHISNHLDFSRKAHAQDDENVTADMRDAQGRLMTVSRIMDYLN